MAGADLSVYDAVVDLASDDLANGIAGGGEGDFDAVGFAAEEGFGEFDGLDRGDFGGHHGCERIDDGLDEDGAGHGEGLIEQIAGLGGIVDADTVGADRPGEGDEVNGEQLALVFGISLKDHLLPLDLSEGVVFDDDDFDGKFVGDCGDDFAHEHGEAAVADDADDLSIGEGDLGGDGVREAAGHGGEVAGARVHLAFFGRHVARPDGGVGAGVGDDDGVFAGTFAELPADDLRLHGCGVIGAFFFDSRAPLLHIALGGFEELPVVVFLEQGKKELKGLSGVAYKAHIGGVAEADALRVGVDLDALGVARFGEKFDIRVGAADDDEGVALFHHVLRGFGSEEADAACGVGRVVGDGGLAEDGLDDGRAEEFGEFEEFVGGVQGSLAGEDDDAFAVVDEIGRELEFVGLREISADGGFGGGVMGDVAVGAAFAGVLQLDVDGDGDVGDTALHDGGADGEIHGRRHVRSTHDAVVVTGDVHEELVEFDVLLGEAVREIGVLHAGDGEHGLLIHFGVVEAVEEVDSAGAGGGEAHTQTTGEFGIGACHKGG